MKLAAIALALAVPAAPALSADLPVKAPVKSAVAVNWTGLYVGVSGGGDWGRFSQTNTTNGISNGVFNQKGGLVGGTLGYNWQMATWVLGLETDLSWTNLSGTQACGPGSAFICTTDARALGTLRGRAGMTVLDNVLLYATGGLAYADIHATRNAGATESDNWRAGWTLGGGAEMMLMPHLSAKLEYLYAAFPGTATTYTIIANGNPIAAEEKDIQIVRAGLNYHF